MRSASEELEVARTLRDAGDLAGAEQTLLAVAGAARARAAETCRRELYTVIRCISWPRRSSVARDDWAAAEDAVKLALAASEALAPKWRTASWRSRGGRSPRGGRFWALRRGAGSSRVGRGRAARGPGAQISRAGGSKAARSVARLRRALDARAPLAALSPNVRRALSVGAAKPRPARRGRSSPRRWRASRRSWPSATRRDFPSAPRRRRPRWTWRRGATAAGPRRGDAPGRRAAPRTTARLLDALGDKATTLRCGHALHTSCSSPRGGGGAATLSALQGAGRLGGRYSLDAEPLRSPSDEGAAAAISVPFVASRRRAAQIGT